MVNIYNKIPRDDVFLGAVVAEKIEPQTYPPAFDQELATLLRERVQALTPDEENLRGQVRDILRNGSYKPTGRGKPASEYLVRRAREAETERVPHEAFPRINAPVDCCNYISLRYLLPISLWDLDRAGVSHFVFRLGREGEAYIFNDAGQPIDLTDLVVGCRASEAGEEGEPIINPVKDSMATKMVEDTSRVAGVIYAPASAAEDGRLNRATAEFAALLAGCGSAVQSRFAVLGPGASLTL